MTPGQAECVGGRRSPDDSGPFLGDPQSGWGYLLAMVPFVLLTPVAAIKTYVVLHFLAAALAAGVAYTLGPFIHHTTYCCNIQAHVAAWLPVALLGVELSHRAGTWSRRLPGLGLAALALSQILAGWIGQGAYNGLLVVGAYLAYRTLTSRGTAYRSIAERVRLLLVSGTVLLLLGFGLGAASVLPRLDVVGQTNLAGGDYGNVEERAGKKGTDIDGLLTRLLAPGFRQRRTALPAAVLALALVAPVLAWRRPAVPYLAVHTVVVLAVQFKWSPVHPLIYLLRGYRDLHEHEPLRSQAVLMIGPALLVAAAVDALPRASWRRMMAASGLILLALAAARFALEPRHHGFVGVGSPVVQVIVAMAALLGLLGLHRRPGPTGSVTGRRLPRLRWIPRVVPVLVVAALLWEPAGRELINDLRRSPVGRNTEQAVAANASDHDGGGAGDLLVALIAESSEPFRYLGYNGADLRTLARPEGVLYHVRRKSTSWRSLLVGARAVRLGLYDLQGYNPVQLSGTVDLFRVINGEWLDYHDAYVLPAGLGSPWLDVLNVRYFIVPLNVPPDRPDLLHLSQRYAAISVERHTRVLVNDDAYPRAWIVHEVRAERTAYALRLVDAGVVDPRRVAFLEPGTVLPIVALPQTPAAESVTVEHFEADAVRYAVGLEAAGVVVLSEMYDPGWHAYVDSDRVPLHRVDGVLRGVAVPAGEHRMELRYEPASIRVGLTVTGGTVIAFTAALTVLVVRGRRGSGRPLTPRFPSSPTARPHRRRFNRPSPEPWADTRHLSPYVPRPPPLAHRTPPKPGETGR